MKEMDARPIREDHQVGGLCGLVRPARSLVTGKTPEMGLCTLMKGARVRMDKDEEGGGMGERLNAETNNQEYGNANPEYARGM